MKAIKICMGLLLITSYAWSQSFRNIELQAAGLTCSMCSNSINKALKQVDFIEGITTDLSKNLFTISIKEGTTPDFDIIRKKVEGAGFSVAKMNVEILFNNQKVFNDEHVVIGDKAFHFLSVKDQVLNGWQKVQVVDKGFLVATQAKKWQTTTKMACYKTGVAESCCANNHIVTGQRMFHITI